MNRFFKNFRVHPLHGPFLRRKHPVTLPRSRYFFLAGLCVLIAGFSGSPAWGFALGAMQVKSNFGERFDARIPISGHDPKDLVVTIGSLEDYGKLGLRRPDVVDSLRVKILPIADGMEQGIDLTSDKPLFYPSFNVVVKVQYGGRTLYENYLISVDFRQSVSLKLKADRPEKTKEIEEPKPVSQSQDVALAGQPEEIPDSPAAPEKSLRKVVAVHPTPLFEREFPEPDYVAALPKPRPSFQKPAPQASRSQASSPEPVSMRDKMASAIGLLTQILQEGPAANIERQVSRSLQVALPLQPTKNMDREVRQVAMGQRVTYGPLKSGETLMKVIARLEYKPADRKKAAVALWLDNRDKFVKNNIHGLKQGETLDLSNLENRLKELDRRQARWLLKNHWQEWKLIRAGKLPGSELKVGPVLQQLLLPAVNQDTKSSVLEVVEGWKTSWEDGDLDRHLSYFSRQRRPGENSKVGNFGHWQRFKKRMFARHKNVRLELFQPQVILMEEKAYVGFDQRFDSDKIRSFGRKNIDLVREGEQWKILKEDFMVKQFLDKEKTLATPTRSDAGFYGKESPKARLVVHASTQIDAASAISLVNGLRQLGFNAYSAPVFIGTKKIRKIHRVFVDRLSNEEAARQLAGVLRQTEFAPFAVSQELPYALQVGIYLDAESAQQQIAEMHRRGYSPMMRASKEPGFPDPVYKVLIGAFLSEQNAKKMSRELTRKSIEWTLVQP